jgi:hypothetical protein
MPFSTFVGGCYESEHRLWLASGNNRCSGSRDYRAGRHGCLCSDRDDLFGVIDLNTGVFTEISDMGKGYPGSLAESSPSS